MKIVDFLSKTNIAMLCLLALTARAVIFGANIGDALAIMAIAGLFAYNKYLGREEKTWMKAVLEEVKYLREVISSIKLRQDLRKADEKPQEKNQRFF